MSDVEAEASEALDGRRLFEAFAVVGLNASAILEQLQSVPRQQNGGHSGGNHGGSGKGAAADVPLSDRFFAARALASFPAAPPGSKLERSLLTLPLFCFPDGGIQFLRLDASSGLRVPRFSSFVVTRDDFSRLYGYSLEFCEPASEALADLAGAGALGAGAWSLPVSLCLLARAECARGAETLLRRIHAMHVARECSGEAQGGPALECTVTHVVRNTPLPLVGAPRILLHAAGVTVELGGGGSLVGGVQLPPLQYGLATLTDTLGVDALLALLGALLLERRVIFVSSQHERLGRAVLCACALLHPLRWQNVLVPLLPAAMLDAMHTPFPALIGLRLEQLLAQGRALPDGVVWVHLDRGRVDGAAASALPLRERRWLRVELQRLLAGEAAPPMPASPSVPASLAKVGTWRSPRARAQAAAPAAEGRAPNGAAAAGRAQTDGTLQLVLCATLASLLRDADGALDLALAPAAARPAKPAGSAAVGVDGGGAEERSAWSRHDSGREATVERALLRRPQAERPFVRALLDTQHVRHLLDRLQRARRERQLPAELAGFVALARHAAPSFFSPQPLPAGTAWLAPRSPANGAGAPEAELPLPPFVIPAEQPQPQSRSPITVSQKHAADAAAAVRALGCSAGDALRAQSGTRFPLDLERVPALQLPLRPADQLGTVPIRDDGAFGGGALSPPPCGQKGWVRLPRLAMPPDLPLRAGALRDELSIDTHRYAEDAQYRADVQRAQGRAGVAAATLAVGGAAAGALLCSVQ